MERSNKNLRYLKDIPENVVRAFEASAFVKGSGSAFLRESI